MQEEHWKLLAGLQKTGCERGKKKLSSFKCWNVSVYIHLNSCQHNLSGILLAVFRFNKINFEFICVVASSLSFSFPPTLREHKNLFYLVPGYILAYLWSFKFIPYFCSLSFDSVKLSCKLKITNKLKYVLFSSLFCWLFVLFVSSSQFYHPEPHFWPKPLWSHIKPGARYPSNKLAFRYRLWNPYFTKRKQRHIKSQR